MTDPFNLQRFIAAQAVVYHTVVEELRTGEKRTHWMWFIFPQIQGLGGSAMARQYAISSRDEARAYLDHPILGARLRECTQLVIDQRDLNGRTVHEIFSSPDDLKFRSCMTLFEAVAGSDSVFRTALVKYFRGERDGLTLARME